jgi:AraC-like DNA-binding protein
MLAIPPDRFDPQVRIANHHPVPAGRAWRDRVLGDLQFILVLAGRFSYTDAAGEAALAPGDVLCIEPGVRHTFAIAGTRRGAITGMHLELARSGRWVDGDYRSDPLPDRVSRPAEPALVREAMLACAKAWAGYGRHRAALVAATARCALVALAGTWLGTAGATVRTTRGRDVLDFIRSRANRPIRRGELARAFAISPQHVDVLFRREFGLTPTMVVTRERCALAYRLLHEEGLPVAVAAGRAGYEDPFYFSRVFARIYGFPPSRAR